MDEELESASASSSPKSDKIAVAMTSTPKIPLITTIEDSEEDEWLSNIKTHVAAGVGIREQFPYVHYLVLCFIKDEVPVLVRWNIEDSTT